MHIRLLAIGDRQPAWVDAGFSSYAERLPREWRFALITLPASKRSKNAPPERAIESEGQALLGKISKHEKLILLDERGKQMTSTALASSLSDWQADGRDIAFAIGGPDGVSDACRQRAEFTWSLSKLTLPHALARVLFAEQMYRAASLLAGHPYHRE
jgi:23S rRNA (pseudouridine1915-N3)-methyltransferase